MENTVYMKTDGIAGNYEVEESVENAMAMIGVIKPREIVQQISGFVPVFDVVINHFQDHLTAVVFGRRWQFCRMTDGVCRASLSKIAKSLSLDEATVMRHTEKLVNEGFLIDLTPERRNRPHVYADAGRVVMKSQLGVELKSIAQSNTTVAESNTGIAESQLIKDSNKDSNRKGVPPEFPVEWQIVSDAEEITQTDEERARRIDFSTLVGLGTSNPPIAYSIAMAFQEQRGITLPESKVKGQRKAIKEMLEMGVTGDHVREATKQLMNNKMTVADLFSVSKTAIDIANKPKEKIEFTRLL
jgi:DNA-binding Lrp family transcriptional regulator